MRDKSDSLEFRDAAGAFTHREWQTMRTRSRFSPASFARLALRSNHRPPPKTI
jgi:hypothetical protein